MGNRRIYILLQEYTCFFGHFYKSVKGGTYNHASIGIDDELQEFYSFRTKWGFCIEHPFYFNKEHKKYIPCAIYQVEVTEIEYRNTQEEIHSFISEREQYHYSYLSVVLGFLGIKHQFDKGYYCSKFVAELLERSGAMVLQKDTSVYFPSDFLQEKASIYFEGNANEYSMI